MESTKHPTPPTTSVRLLSSVLLFVVPLACGDDGRLQTDSSLSEIVNGSVVNPAPPWIAKMGAGCTGTLIYPQWVMSAGHCGSQSFVRLGGSTWSNGTRVNITQSFILSTGAGSRDLALHKLSNSVSNQTMELNRDPSLLARVPWVLSMGYGNIGTTTSNPGGLLRRTGWLPVTRVGHDAPIEFAGNDGQGICFGDSGGPLLGDQSAPRGIYILVGVNSFTSALGCGVRSGAADIAENIGWIDNTVNSNGGPGGTNNGGGSGGGNNTCVDSNASCAYWASIGECSRNPRWMLPNCRASCYQDTSSNCGYWASIGECTRNPGWMLPNCPDSCNHCPGS